MPVQNYFQGMAPLGAGMGNALSQIAILKQRDRALATDEQQNALMQQRLQMQQDANDQADEEEQQFIAAIQAGDWATAYALDRETADLYAKHLQAQEQAKQGPVMPESQRIGPFDVLMQGGNVKGYRSVPEPKAAGVVGSAAGNMQQPKPFRTLSPEEAQAQGFPQGAVIQENTKTGEVKVVSKSDYTPKDINTARAKLTQIKVAREALTKARQRFTDAPDSEKGGPVAGGLSMVGVFPRGQAFQAAIDGLRGSITAITRTPGVGSMSDYETRMDQAKFPNFWFDRETTMDQKMQQLEDLLAAMEQGYSDIAGASPSTGSKRIRYDAQGNRL